MTAQRLPAPSLPASPAPAGPMWAEAVVALNLGQGGLRLADGRLAHTAASCLLSPLGGDTVLVASCEAGLFVTHVLLRGEPASPARLEVAGADRVALAAGRLELEGVQGVSVRSLGDVELTSAGGALNLNARHILSCAAETLVQSAEHLVTRVAHCVMQATALMRLHGRQALVTADDEMKLDAERISLG